MAKNQKISVKGLEITMYKGDMDDYISLTDIARHKDSANTDDVVKNRLRNRNTIELLGFREQMYNPNFKPVEFDGFRKQAGLNSFVLTPIRWIESTNALGIASKAGRYGGTYAHQHCISFCHVIKTLFWIYLVKEFQRLNRKENDRFKLDWKPAKNTDKIQLHHSDRCFRSMGLHINYRPRINLESFQYITGREK